MEKGQPVQLELMPHPLQLTTLPPPWTHVVDVRKCKVNNLQTAPPFSHHIPWLKVPVVHSEVMDEI